MEGSEGPLICQMGVSGRYRLCKPAGCGEAEALSAFSRDGRGGCSLLRFTHCKWKLTLQSACVGHQHTLERELFVRFKTTIDPSFLDHCLFFNCRFLNFYLVHLKCLLTSHIGSGSLKRRYGMERGRE